ncbi:MAG TPA: ZIP family metal transporter [Steroidobacteraceae bacterium]|jgi:ZIP family zinc transporter|nr:ZIP family metal transporter [Steroidobacteraceae bacterium]
MLLIVAAAFCATCAGGLFALRLKDKLHLVLGFSAGAVVAVALFDLLPEALEMGSSHTASTLLSWLTLSFMLYLVLDRVKLLHRDVLADAHARGAQQAMLGAGSFSAHSFLDGVAIGVAFQASTAVGGIVTLAVLTHDFSDGINTVNVVLKNGGTRRQAMRWLFMDAAAPAAGVASTLLFTIPRESLGVALAVFAGFFLYIGASDLIPESHHAHPKIFTTIMTLLGAGVIYLSVQLAGG